ncbi:MAG: acetoacetate--CoA ligase [Rhodospirillales bacterium]|jgi:acetoacetyl-CoA synthetase
MSKPLWQPSPERSVSSRLAAFISSAENQWGVSLKSYKAAHRFSIEHPEKFWTSVWDFTNVIATSRGERLLINPSQMPGAQFFPDAQLNYAENLLRRRDETPAIFFRAEDQIERQLTWRELYDEVSRLSQAMRNSGIRPGDCVAGFLPNIPEAVIACLATASLGAVWTSCSPDFGIQGVLDRFGQAKPRMIFTADGYFYQGKVFESLERMRTVTADLPTVENIIVFPFTKETPDLASLPGATSALDFVAGTEAQKIDFTPVAFNSPLFIMYSSGTTGVPKCIVHSVGGVLLQHLKEHQLHCDIKPGDRVFYATTCGWMMWNWLISALASEASIVLYDGAPFYPKPEALFDLADATGITLFGTSSKYLDALAKEELSPKQSHKLSELRTVTSTGSPLMPEGFHYVYNHIKSDVCLSSMSGGTDIVACFVGGNPMGAVWPGEIQAPILGMDTAVFDQCGNGIEGEKGELVCRNAFPSMPIRFLDGPAGTKYQSAYFERYPGVWHHGDFAATTEHGGFVIYGRSDATLNAGGVRIGTAEIYRQVEQLSDVQEALCIGQEWQGDTRIVLFVRLSENLDLQETLCEQIRKRIRDNCSPRHVPAKIIHVKDIPRTKSGKITEIAVRDVVHGRPVKNREALANPEALDLYSDLPRLQEP